MAQELDARKIAILEAVVEEYIETAEPIGSRSLSKKFEFGFSPATIRNEMSDLEEMGYLIKPHTSAGRIPSEKAYRYYVDNLFNSEDDSTDLIEYNSMRIGIENKINELNEVIRQASNLISKLTNYTSIAISATTNNVAIKAVQIVPLETGKALVIVVASTDAVKNYLINVPVDVTADQLIRISNDLGARLVGLTIKNINSELIDKIERDLGYSLEILIPIFDGILKCVELFDKPQIYKNGVTNILNQPEFKDIEKAQQFLHILDEEEKLQDLISFDNESNFDLDEGIYVKIGSENNIEEMNRCSFVTATYKVGNDVIGKIGIIGPTRMDYAKALKALKSVREQINCELRYYIEGDNDNKTKRMEGR